ncbi:uncharacterized protein LOC126717674 isoform X4 [Quercus robur]|uniref:uncharacterized protein LOC126717674 isoform X3 n=1 Tax=Quercus robur TaxID=38942 RepID=UPI002161627B|nr:uncharacterized protein LOC126717674 isoform X3 [Quercus robur]XP_050275470.1 uncharacterized protein LOC126717674 isoform X4 [Quercus robur]
MVSVFLYRRDEVESLFNLEYLNSSKQRKHLARESAHLVLNKALSQCKVLIAIKSQRVVEKLLETNKKMAINYVEKRAKIVNILMHQEIYGK